MAMSKGEGGRKRCDLFLFFVVFDVLFKNYLEFNIIVHRQYFRYYRHNLYG